MSFRTIVDNYINGNLTDFKNQYSEIANKKSFILKIEYYYGKKLMLDILNFLDKRGISGLSETDIFTITRGGS